MACWTRPRDCNVIVYFWISYPIYHHKWMTVSNEEIARVLFIFLRPLLLLLLFPYFRCPGDTTKSNQIKFRKLRKELVNWKNKARGPKCCYMCSAWSSARVVHLPKIFIQAPFVCKFIFRSQFVGIFWTLAYNLYMHKLWACRTAAIPRHSTAWLCSLAINWNLKSIFYNSQHL